MSGQTVTGNALQFTNDNKYAYMNTGRVDFDGTETTVAEMTTTTQYIVGKLTCSVENDGSDDIRIRLYFNDEQVMGDISTSPPGVGNLAFNPLRILIPPFTTVKITYDNEGSASTRTSLTMFKGKVGMPQRVGNLDE